MKKTVEYRFEGTSGPLVIGLHGAPGSCFQMNLLLDRLNITGEHFRRLTVTRPGYGGTPIASGESIADQCDLLAELLDELKLDEPAVMTAFSAGGIPALEFARRYPERVSKLLLLSPVTGQLAMFGENSAERLFNSILYSGVFMRIAVFFTELFPRLVLRSLLKEMTRIRGDALICELDRLAACPEDSKFLLDVIRLGLPFRHMKRGIWNDDRNTLGADVNLFRDVKQPILIFHGTRDADVPIRQSEQLRKLLPSNTELIRVPNSGHLLLLHPQLPELRQRAAEFLR